MAPEILKNLISISDKYNPMVQSNNKIKSYLFSKVFPNSKGMIIIKIMKIASINQK